MHQYYAGLVAAGHKVIVQVPDRIKSYDIDGVHVEHLGSNMRPRFARTDVCVSIHGDDARLHRVAMTERMPSVRFVHGTHDTLFHNLVKHGEPTLTVFNSHSLAEYVGYTGEHMVCHPIIDPTKFATTPGDAITLVNLIEPKGYLTFDALARYLPKRLFLGVRGGYGPQPEGQARKNVTIIKPTGNVRDDILAKTRILLMPSDHETWGMIGVEAMCSVPVIAHPTPGLKESLGPAGLFADRDDLDAWLDIIEDLDDPRKYARQVKLCKQRVDQLAKDDSLTRFIKKLEEVVG